MLNIGTIFAKDQRKK